MYATFFCSGLAGERFSAAPGGSQKFIDARFARQIIQLSRQCIECAFAPDCAQHVLRDDIAGAFPNRAEVCIARQARIRPFFDVAGAAAHFHRVAGGAPRITAGAELEQWREDANALLRGELLSRIASVGRLQCARGGKHDRTRRFGGQQNLAQLAAGERHFDQAFTECDAMFGHMPRLKIRAPHQAGGTHAV